MYLVSRAGVSESVAGLSDWGGESLESAWVGVWLCPRQASQRGAVLGVGGDGVGVGERDDSEHAGGGGRDEAGLRGVAAFDHRWTAWTAFMVAE